MTRRRGFALILVLGFVAVSVTLSLAFAYRTSAALPRAANALALAQARRAAASGVGLAAHHLMYPPTGVAACDFWPGSAGATISIDGSTLGCKIGVTKPDNDPRVFRVVSEGTVTDSAGAVRGRRTVTADLVLPPPNRWCVNEAFIASGQFYLPNMLRFFGNVHVNGNIASSLAWCNGVVSATGAASWFQVVTFGPPTAVQPNQPARRVAGIKISDCQNYKVDGVTYQATVFNQSWMTKDDAIVSGAVTPQNPGGVVIATGNLLLYSSIHFNGTLVVPTDLQFDGTAIRITPVAGYPAVVVGDDIEIQSENTSVTLSGPVLLGGEFRKGGRKCNLNIDGPVIGAESIGTASTGSACNITAPNGGSVFHNFSGTADRQPYTILRWTES